MALAPGVRLGPYEIASLIGAGGMGEVYKARDTRLNRTVAIKLLRADAADRPERRQRFESEARAISSLSHPSICMLFDVGVHDGQAFIVMEYLEGETLEDRLTRGALPAEAVLSYGGQIADALDHAHGQHLVHRDLKPSNVMLTASGAKLLDFGLAKELESLAAGHDSTASFEQRRLTADGAVIGTFQYMAPEQLEGKTVDARTDVFAFGALIYEMATGRRAFDGDSQASLIASILTAHPAPVSSARSIDAVDLLPAALDHLVDRCLAKQPADRWQTARDLKLELEWIGKSGGGAPRPAAARTRSLRPMAWALAVAGFALASVVTVWYRPSSPPLETTRFSIAAPAGAEIGLSQNRPRFALSPDGRQLAFVAWKDGRSHIWVRSLSVLDARMLDATDGAQSPFWSPDSRFIGFFADTAGELRKVEAAGGPATTICPAQSDGGITWGPDGTILFTQFRDGIYRCPASGGAAVRVTTPNKAQREMNHYWPSFLPGGRRFFFLATSRDANGRREVPTVYVASLDLGELATIGRMASKVVYSSSGHVLFVQDGALMAQPFDLNRTSLVGEAQRVADGVGYYKALGNAAFELSANGILAYQGSEDLAELTWYDRRGSVTEIGWPVQSFGSLRLSPDGERVAVDVIDPRTGASDIWIYDILRGVPSRFTVDGFSREPVWAPDARRLAFSTGRSQAPALFARAFDGREESLADQNSPLYPDDWSRDGKWLAYRNSTRLTGADLFLLPLAGDHQSIPFIRTNGHEWDARFSPDSAWVAFVSSEFGRPEVYVTAVGGGEKTRVSTNGGTSPRWRRDGRELFYAAADNKTIMSVPVEIGATFKPGPAQHLFTMRSEAASRAGLRYTAYDVTPDGSRFLVSVPTGEPTASRLTVVMHWPSALR